jgi:membrane protein YqaA with SNARE-associated domain
VTPAAADVVIPSGALAALVVLSLVELALVIFCIVDIVRRPAVLGDRKWVWIVIVAVFNLVGSIIYLAIGRVQPPPTETRAEPGAAGGRVAAAADILYGPAGGVEAPDVHGPSSPSPDAKEHS